MEPYRQALDVIEIAFAECPEMIHETTYSLCGYVETLGDAWVEVYRIISHVEPVGRAIAVLIENNECLSGHPKNVTAQRMDPEGDYDDTEWMYCYYVQSLDAIADILRAVTTIEVA